MARLTIKGHKTRGKEVIKIFEMLGGVNKDNYNGSCFIFCYYIDADGYIYNYYVEIERHKCSNMLIYGIEEFLEMFPYKIGDKVQHKGATSCGSVFEVEKMRWVDNHVEYTIKHLKVT